MRHYIDQDLLSGQHRANIILVGAGGTGSHVLAGLAMTHHSLVALGNTGFHVTVYDDDIVSEANVGRQAFSVADVGNLKASIAVSRMNGHYGLDWDAYPYRYPNQEIEHDSIDLLVTCVDTAKARVEIANHIKQSSKKPKYWLDMGNSKDSGQVILGTCQDIPQPPSEYETFSKLPTIVELYPDLENMEDDDTPSCSVFEALTKQNLFVNSIMADLAANLVWTLFKNAYIEVSGYFSNIAGGNVTPLRIDPNYWSRCGYQSANFSGEKCQL